MALELRALGSGARDCWGVLGHGISKPSNKSLPQVGNRIVHSLYGRYDIMGAFI